jgi:hypothetical protein
MKGVFLRGSIFILLTGLGLLQNCSDSGFLERGHLQGVVTIGPICPVVTDPPLPACLPTAETYKAYQVGIWTSNGRSFVSMINPELDGNYEIELLSGTYLVKLVNQQTVAGSNLPVLITISGAGTTLLNINIDTGIR